ncbi:MAG TPA: YceI family protein [Actinomycetota bacterium]|nr:YceI family protein [Actinomycetota bacterium]
MADARTKVDGVQPPPAGKYELDLAHTAVEFVARHILTKVRGRFTDFSGWIDVTEPIEESSVHVEVKTASIQTNTEQRDEHLKSDDFLNVEKWPVMTFQSRAVRHTGGVGFELDGDLTIRDQTRPVTLVGEYLGTETNPYGKTILAATARTTLEREDWNVSWNMLLETGGFLVSKTVDLEIEVEALKTG